MSAEFYELKPSGSSRRSFLAKLGLGVAGLATISNGLVRLGAKKPASSTDDEFPGLDSIFHPARDPRTDPRRRQS